MARVIEGRRLQIAVLLITVASASLSLSLFSGSLPIYLHREHGYSVQSVGFFVGIAFVVELVATLAVGPLLDRFGVRLALRVGPMLYLSAALFFLITANPLGIAAARVLQGIGIGMILPAAYAVVPYLFSARIRGTALGAFGVLQNLALAVGPPLGLWLLRRSAVILFITAAVAAGFAATISVLLRVGATPQAHGPLLKYRAAWTPLYALTFLTNIYWGVVTAYLPIHVPGSQVAAVGWFFTADALGVLAFRVPAGFFSDHFGSRWIFVSGILLTVAAIGLILVPPGLLTLVIAGVGSGAGAALLIPPTVLELQKCSDDSDRGTAMALWTTSFAAAIGVGSLAAAPLVEHVSFDAAMVVCAALCLAAIPIALTAVRTDKVG